MEFIVHGRRRVIAAMMLALIALPGCALVERADRFSLGLDVSTGVPGLPEVRFGLDIEDSSYVKEITPPDFDRLSQLDYELQHYLEDQKKARLSQHED